MTRSRGICAFLLVLSSASAASDSPSHPSTQLWREQREAKLKAADGWLAVAGLFWLKPGANTFGGEGNAIVLPRVSAKLGSFDSKDGVVSLRPVQGAGLLVNGQPARPMQLKTDKDGKSDMLTIGKLTMFVIKRGPRMGLRLRDEDSQFRREFTHLNWYPIQSEYRVTGTFEPYAQKKRLSIDTIIGEPDIMWSPGKVTMTIQGKQVTLEPVEDEGKLWFIFRDLTTGKTTYGGGRFLYADMPVNGKVVVDFNQAYNPPCVFTPYATCPLPPPQNRLALAIPAGELRYGKH